MTKAAPKKPADAARANWVRIHLLWKLFEIEGEGALPVAGALLLGMIILFWTRFFH